MNFFFFFCKALKSAMLIQRWFRRYQSRIEAKKKTVWNIYQSIEYSGEQDQLKLCNFFLTLIKNSAFLNSEINSSQLKFRQMSFDSNNENSLYSTTSKNTELIQKVFSLSIDKEDHRKILDYLNNCIFFPNKIKFFFIKIAVLNKRKTRPIVIEPDYQGLEIKFPIVKQNFHDLVNNFKMRKVKFNKKWHGLF